MRIFKFLATQVFGDNSAISAWLACIMNLTKKATEFGALILITLTMVSKITLAQPHEEFGEFGYEEKSSKVTFYSFEAPVGELNVCAEDKAVGLIWERGAWRSANFKGSTYVLKKLDHLEQKNKKWIPCNKKIPKDSCSPSGCILNRCYDVKVMGNTRDIPPTSCREFYSDSDSGRKLNILSCGEFPYDPVRIEINKGYFALHTLNTTPTPSKEGNGMWVSHGKCSKM